MINEWKKKEYIIENGLYFQENTIANRLIVNTQQKRNSIYEDKIQR